MGASPVLLLVLFLVCFVTFGECTISVNTPKETEPVGNTAVITCTITDGEKLLGWFKPNGQKVTKTISERIYYEENGDEYKLRIKDIQNSDQGNYECRGNTGDKKTFTLWIQPDFKAPVKKTQYLRLYRAGVIQVTVLGFPKPEITWKDKDGKVVSKGDSRYELLADGSLRIKRVEKINAGKYMCHLQQLTREKNVEIEVIPSLAPEILQPPHPEKRYVTKGYNTTFKCVIDGYPQPIISWLDPSGRRVSTFNARYQLIGSSNETFMITDIHVEDKGKWTCQATQGSNVVSAYAEILDVYESPKIYRPAFPWVYYPQLFKEYTIACKASGKPTPTVVIRKDGRIHPKLDVSEPGAAYIRTFLIRQHDLGNYSCEAWSQARDSEGDIIVVNQTFAMFTKDKPVVNEQGSPKVIYSYVGNPKPLVINCDFVSWPKANVTIWRGFYELTNGTDQATLYVWSYSWEDFGPYSCIGSNIYGEVNYTVWIKHATPPAKPSNIKVLPFCNSVNITWDPPDDTGGMEIDRYVMTNQAGQKYNTNDSYPEWKFLGLEKNKEYTITIRSMNRQGAGAPATVTFRTNATCVPMRPIVYSPVAKVLDRTFLVLRWNRPENAAEDDKLFYKMVVRELEDVEEIGHTKLYRSSTTEQRIGGLSKNITYRFELRAVNEQNQESDPTYTNYYVDQYAFDSAHALSASLCCVALGVIAAVLNSNR